MLCQYSKENAHALLPFRGKMQETDNTLFTTVYTSKRFLDNVAPLYYLATIDDIIEFVLTSAKLNCQ